MATAPSIDAGFPDSLRRAGTLRRSSPLAIDRMLIQAALVIGLLLINKAGVPGAAVFFAILFMMVTLSPEMAFKAFTIGFLGLVANQEIVPKTAVWTVGRLLLPFICLARFSFDLQLLRTSLFQRGYFVALMLFGAVAAFLSILTHYFVGIALLKLVSFLGTAMAVFSGVQVLRMRHRDLTEWYVTLCLTTVVLGAGSIVTGIGYNMRGTGVISSTFNGPFYHSNTLGPLAAMMVVYLACVIIFGRYRNTWTCLAIAAPLAYFMMLTRSRTSFASLFVGLLIVVGLSFVLARRGQIKLRMNLSRFFLLGSIAAAGITLLAVDAVTGRSITNAIVSFANKGGRSAGLDINQVVASRLAIVEASWQNFLESPLIGIGFEVAKTEYFVRNATLLSAPIEKGFLPVAVLEETGLIGTFFFVMFLITFLLYLARDLNVPGIALFLTFLAVNCGESMFFAMGGHGALGWLLFAGGMLLGDYCIERTTKLTTHVPRS